MQIVHKDQRKKFENGKNCIAYEYPMRDKDINGAIIEIAGRYPEVGLVTNEVCKELVYVVNGTGKVVVEEKEYQFNEGDMFLINPGEKFYFEGVMTLCMPLTPAFYPEQHKHIA